jgi:hypothetical protein
LNLTNRENRSEKVAPSPKTAPTFANLINKEMSSHCRKTLAMMVKTNFNPSRHLIIFLL